MLTFKEWVNENHPTDEGFKDWAKKAALGTAILGAGVGLGKFAQNAVQTPSQSQSWTSPDAADFIGQDTAKPKTNNNSPAMQRWKDKIQKNDRIQASKNKGTSKEVKSSRTSFDAKDFLN